MKGHKLNSKHSCSKLSLYCSKNDKKIAQNFTWKNIDMQSSSKDKYCSNTTPKGFIHRVKNYEDSERKIVSVFCECSKRGRFLLTERKSNCFNNIRWPFYVDSQKKSE